MIGGEEAAAKKIKVVGNKTAIGVRNAGEKKQ
jgi:hypothetical protein